MKKSIVFFSFVLACVMLCTMFLTRDNTNITKASAKTINNKNQTIVVVGKGEVEVEPDSIQINFGLKTRADSLQAGQTKIKESFDNVVSKIKQVDDSASVYVNYSSSYPVSEGGLLAYEFDCGLVAKSAKVEQVNDIIDSIVSSGATSIHNTSYTLLNREDSYVQALVKARYNADQKVKAMYSDATLVGLREENCYSYCESSRGENIKVCAKVKAVYEVSSLQDSAVDNSTANNTTTNVSNISNLNNQKKLDKTIQNNTTSNTAKNKTNITNNANSNSNLTTANNNTSISQTANSNIAEEPINKETQNNSVTNNNQNQTIANQSENKNIDNKTNNLIPTQNDNKTNNNLSQTNSKDVKKQEDLSTKTNSVINQNIQEDKSTQEIQNNRNADSLKENNNIVNEQNINSEIENNKNKTSNTFNQDKSSDDAVNVLNENKINQTQNRRTKERSKINSDNLIVKADKTLARNDDASLNENYKEIA